MEKASRLFLRERFTVALCVRLQTHEQKVGQDVHGLQHQLRAAVLFPCVVERKDESLAISLDQCPGGYVIVEEHPLAVEIDRNGAALQKKVVHARVLVRQGGIGQNTKAARRRPCVLWRFSAVSSLVWGSPGGGVS